jgi:hypothetical protein
VLSDAVKAEKVTRREEEERKGVRAGKGGMLGGDGPDEHRCVVGVRVDAGRKVLNSRWAVALGKAKPRKTVYEESCERRGERCWRVSAFLAQVEQ